jgi:hypothetical protein
VKVDDELAHNTETGAYEWELALPSHYVTEGNLASAWFWFEAEHKDDSTKVLVLPSRSINLDSSQGNTEIALTMNVTVPNLPSYVTLETGFDVVQLGGTATAIITPPAKHGLIASSVYVNGSSYSYPSIDNSNGTIKITVSVPNSLDSTYDFIKVNFFHLKGTVSSSSAIYPVKSVEAYRVDAEGNTSPIGTPATVTGGTTNSWEINVPSDYVFWNWSSVEDVNKVYFKVNFGTTASSAILYTHDDRTTTGKSVNTLIPGSPYDTVNLGSIAPFQLTGVKAAIETSTVIVISWDAATWATGGYDVYDSSDGGVNYGSTPVNGSTPVTSTSYRHTGLSISDGATYYYKVIGKRADGTEGAPVYTRVSKLSVNALPTTTSGGLLNSVNVSWSNVSSAAEYYVERRTNGGNWTYLTRTTSTYYSDSNVEMVDDYYEYRVTARADSNISNSATDTSQTSSIVRAPTAQPISWYTGYNYSIGSGETHIYRLSNSGYNSYYAYLNLSSNYGNSYFTVFNSRNKSSRSYTSISGDLFTLYDSGVYSDLILVVEGRWGSDSYYFNINPW